MPIYQVARLLAIAFSLNSLASAQNPWPGQPQPGDLAPVIVTVEAPVVYVDLSPTGNTYPSPTSTWTTAASTSTSAPTNEGNGQWCVDFTSSDPSFMWAYDRVWGSVTDTHSFGEQNPSGCFNGSGAMYVGTSGLSGGTKFECTFAADQANCDVSLCDGYSLAMSCSVPAENYLSGPNPIGGTTDLFSKNSCPSGVSNGICHNPNGHDNVQPAGSSVSAFFVEDAFWYNDFVSEQVQYSYTGNPHMTCSVSGSSGTSNVKREANETEAGELKIRDSTDSELLKVHSHAYTGRTHARGLRNVVRAPRD